MPADIIDIILLSLLLSISKVVLQRTFYFMCKFPKNPNKLKVAKQAITVSLNPRVAVCLSELLLAGGFIV